MGYNNPTTDLGWIRNELLRVNRRIDELTRPGAGQLYKTLATLADQQATLADQQNYLNALVSVSASGTISSTSQSGVVSKTWHDNASYPSVTVDITDDVSGRVLIMVNGYQSIGNTGDTDATAFIGWNTDGGNSSTTSQSTPLNADVGIDITDSPSWAGVVQLSVGTHTIKMTSGYSNSSGSGVWTISGGSANLFVQVLN